MSKLDALSAIRAGDLGPNSEAISPDVLDDLRSLGRLSGFVQAVPTADGAVALEWQYGRVEYTAKIEPGHRLFMCTDDTVTDELEETETDFDVSLLTRFVESGRWASS